MAYPYDVNPSGPLQVPNSPLKPQPQGFGVPQGPGQLPQFGMQPGMQGPNSQPQPEKPGLERSKEAELAAYLSQFDLQLQEQELVDKMAYADALRRKAPEGRDSGRVYTAANPLEHIGTAWQNYNAMKMRKKAEEDRRTANAARGTNVKDVGMKLLKREEI